jgi:hypothetical protein
MFLYKMGLGAFFCGVLCAAGWVLMFVLEALHGVFGRDLLYVCAILPVGFFCYGLGEGMHALKTERARK